MIDTIVYENKNNLIKVAGLSGGRLDSIDIVDLSKPLEGNIYLGRIVKKIDLANGKTGYFVDLGSSKEAFMVIRIKTTAQKIGDATLCVNALKNPVASAAINAPPPVMNSNPYFITHPPITE